MRESRRVAGKQKGFEYNGERTRSGLFFEALRIIEFLQPEYAICENVKALTSKKFEKEFNTVLNSLAEVGYNNYWKVLNAKDYGIPQNRERVFIISIRKDIDTGAFTFPEKQELKLRVKDVLEPVVDEKYYIDNERSRNLIRQILAKTDIGGSIAVVDSTINNPNVKDISNCIKARYDAGIENQRSVGTAVIEPKIKRLGNLYDENAGGARAGNVYAPDGLAPALQTAQGGNRQPLIFSNDPVICRSIGRNPDNPSDRTAGIPTEQRLEPNTDGVSNTLTTVQKDNYLLEPKKILQPVVIGSTQKHASVNTDGTVPCLTAMMGLGGGNVPMVTDNQNDCCGYRIRKLTPLECFRLMGFTDEDFDKIKGISNTQLYKMAGNSIVVNVLEAIFKQLFKENHKDENQSK